ncbi:pentatricopeptide repeat-containing protein At3g59040 isoform X2 [Cryptomeria japonica]|uniref:pentatricopeptide repeat-containing protein At3g59040 isoform X2 n=1 Tax=Cryptomeria japonica TaxID=3369 RepID=UPI0025AC5AE1|nr:pentatricopeptide repeat-containing protein At3g59040 isoform X2 [Cryptomeria japonica]
MDCLCVAFNSSPLNFSHKLHPQQPLKVGALPCFARASANLAVSSSNKKAFSISSSSSPSSEREWREMMMDIESCGSAVPVLRSLLTRRRHLPRELLVGTLVRFTQLKQWNTVTEDPQILEWLRWQYWWNFSEMDFKMLVSAYGKQGDSEKAEGTLRSMKKSGLDLDVVSYTALMEAYGRAGHYNRAESIFRQMKSSGPEPSVLTYHTIIKLFVEGGKFETAESVFNDILDDEKSKVKPDQRMFQLMIHMYKKAGKSDQALQIYEQMVARGIPLSTVTFNILMSGQMDFKKTSRVFNQLQHAGFRPDVVSYTQLISAYGKARREESAQAVFDEMVDAGVRPTRKAYNVLLDAYAKCALVDGAKSVFKRMMRDRCHPDLCSYSTLLSAYVNASDMEGAEKFFLRLKRDGIVPNIVTYGILIKGYAKINNLDEMTKKYDEMRLQGIKANQTIFTTLMDAYGKNIDFGSAVVWFKEMVASGNKPDRKAKNILLSLAKNLEEKQEALDLVGSSQE